MDRPTDLQLEDLLNNPKAYGLPTFEEFAAKPEKWRQSAERIFEMVDIGSTNGLKNVVAKHEYEILGYKCNSLEEDERVAKNEGIALASLEIKPEILPQGGGKCNILVRFTKKPLTTEQVVDEAIRGI